MANDRIVLEFSLKDVGDSIKAGNKDAKELKSTLESIQKLASSTSNKPKSSYKNAAMGSSEYDTTRGITGQSGASGRDFANQARGLDGLVRLYATYAANLFAAGAAFRALSNAADTSNMVEGMNQLGAASGLALGTIAKKLVEATDGAISFREAMEATTKGTAAGLSSKQMEQLGQVANKASKALGIAMPDAISRLTRGISKLEPELLDELGLFTKIGPATDNYARSIGKAASSLTDFEKRQAFATAVLKEGLDKFNAIDIMANPYDKLLASLKNVSQTILEVINKAVTPLVDLLSKSPTALVAGIALLASTIIQKALPAIGNYRSELRQAADNEKALTVSKLDAAKAAKATRDAELIAVKDRAATQRTAKVDELENKLKTLTGGKIRKDIKEVLSPEKGILDIKPEDLAKLDSAGKQLKDRNNIYVQLAAAIRAAQAEEQKYLATVRKIENERKNPPRFSQVGILDRQAKEQQKRGMSRDIISNAAETASLVGFGAALVNIRKEIDPKQLGYFRAGMTGVAAATTAAAVRIGGLVSGLGNVGMVIGALIGAFELFDSWLSKTEKESTAYSKSLTDLNDAGDSANRTLAALAKQPGIATASISGVVALSNASHEVTGNIEATIDSSKNLLKALNNSAWDSAKNTIAGLFGKDIQSTTAKNLANTVQTQLKLFQAAGMGEEASADFKKAIGVNSLDVDTLTKAFKDGTGAQDAFAKSNKALDVKLLEASSNLQSFKTATEALTKAYDEFIQSTASSNPLFKIGTALEDLSIAMDKLANGSIDKLDAAFNDLVDNPKKIAQFGKAFVDQFVAIRQEFKTTLQDYTAYAQSISSIQDQIAQKQEQKKNAKSGTDRSIGIGQQFSNMLRGDFSGNYVTAEKKRAGLDTDIGFLKQGEKILTDKQQGLNLKIFADARDLFTKGISDSFKEGSRLINIALGQAADKAALSIAQAGVGALSGQQAAQETGRLKQEDLKIQMQQVQSTIDLIASNTLLTATMTESNALMADAQARKDNAPREVQSETSAALLAAQIVKKAMGNVSEGKLKGSELETVLTGNPQVDKYIKQQLLPFKRQTAQQQATQTELGGKQKATEIETARADALGRLEDLNKQRNLVNDINQQLSARVDILAGIDNLNSAQRVNDKTNLENLILQSKQTQEIDGYQTAINNALALRTPQGNAEAAKQTQLLNLVKARQKFENDNKGLADRIKLQAAELNDAIKLNALKEAIVDQNIAMLNTITSIAGISTEQNVKEIARLESIKQQSKFAFELQQIQNNINNLLIESGEVETESVSRAKQELALVQQRQQAEKDNKGLQDALKLLEARASLERELAGFRKTAADAQSQQAEDDLNYKKELGLITSEQFAREKADIDRARQARDYQKDLNGLLEKQNKLKLIAKQIEDYSEFGGGADYEALIASYQDLNSVITAEGAAIEATNAQKMNAINLSEKMADKMTGFSKIVENGFQSMADALADFARTGKLDFKGLVDSMIVDLIRFELRAQMSSLYGSMGGLGGMLGMLTGVGRPGSNSFVGPLPENMLGPLFPSAKGSVYDTGLQTFAKGGMFTNSVVTEPTMFKYAKGTGLMGEAGPEAIMPLKRDSNGNLGVRGPGGGGNVDVVVNNYGNEKATTKETTDSRGNRRIEVIVGDMVASELSRPGSSVQQSLASNYGNRPTVARR